MRDVGISPDSKNAVLVGGGTDPLYVSTDVGETWEPATDVFWSSSLSIEAVEFGSRTHAIAVGGESALISSDGGKSWRNRRVAGVKDFDTERGEVLHGVAIAENGFAVAVGRRSDELAFYSMAGDGVLYASEDGGDSWTDYVAKLEEDRESLLQEVREVEIGGTGGVVGQSPGDRAMEMFVTTAPLRLAIVILVLFLVQVLVSLSRYSTRLAAFYLARADTLLLLSDGGDSVEISAAETLTSLTSPDQLDFGKTPKAVVQHAMDLATELSSGRRGGTTR